MSKQNIPIQGSITFQGDVAGSVALEGQPIAGSLQIQLPNVAPLPNQLLTATAVNGYTVTLGWSTHNATGDITSVALTAPPQFTVSGSPITAGDGTLGLAWANVSANQVLAGPGTGSPAVPGFRALVANDLPSIDVSKINATGTPSSTTFLRGDGSWQTISAGGFPASLSADAETLNNGHQYVLGAAESSLSGDLQGWATGATLVVSGLANQPGGETQGIVVLAQDTNYVQGVTVVVEATAPTGGSVYGLYSESYSSGTGSQGQIFGLLTGAFSSAVGGPLTVNEQTGIFVEQLRTTGATVNEAYGIHVNGFKPFTGPAVPVSATLNAAIGIEDQGNDAATFSIYSKGGRVRFDAPVVPATMSDTGAPGEVAWDANYIYVCTAANTWKRTPIETNPVTYAPLVSPAFTAADGAGLPAIKATGDATGDNIASFEINGGGSGVQVDSTGKLIINNGLQAFGTTEAAFRVIKTDQAFYNPAGLSFAGRVTLTATNTTLSQFLSPPVPVPNTNAKPVVLLTPQDDWTAVQGYWAEIGDGGSGNWDTLNINVKVADPANPHIFQYMVLFA